MVGGLIAANSSTILTHLNWGASYLVHDFYRRFIRRDADEKHYVWWAASRPSALFVCSSALVFVLDTAKDAFDIILQVGAGTGPAVSGAMVLVARQRLVRSRGDGQLVRCLARVAGAGEKRRGDQHARGAGAHDCRDDGVLGDTAYVGPQTDRRVLIEFYRKVRPAGPGWAPIRAVAGVSDAEAPPPATTSRWRCSAGSSAARPSGRRSSPSATILYGRYSSALLMGAVFVVSGSLAAVCDPPALDG